MEIRLSPQLEAAVARGIASGRYASAEEYVAEAVELLAERDGWREETLEETREKLEEAWQQAERGEVFTLEEVRDHMNEMKSKWRAARQVV
jgi:putative addiction module CopG family antidote